MNTYEVKQLSNARLLYVMAASAEYGEHLKKRFTPLMTGIGPVEAAITLTREFTLMADRGTLPDYIISLGSAGSRDLEQTGIYQASSVWYRDMDASPFGFERGATPYLDLPVHMPLDHHIKGVESATLSTGANVMSGPAAYEHVDAQMVDMETFALLRVAQQFGVPLIALRGISDGAEDVHHISDWTDFLHVIDEKLAKVVDMLEQQIEAEQAAS